MLYLTVGVAILNNVRNEGVVYEKSGLKEVKNPGYRTENWRKKVALVTAVSE